MTNPSDSLSLPTLTALLRLSSESRTCLPSPGSATHLAEECLGGVSVIAGRKAFPMPFLNLFFVITQPVLLTQKVKDHSTRGFLHLLKANGMP